MSNHLFVYGTLRPAHAPDEISDVVNTLKPIGAGTIRGQLHDFGEYPGVILLEENDETTTDLVHGQVFELPSSPHLLASLLARMDDYEDFRPHDPANSLFLRQLTPVTLADGTHPLCWVYVYNRSLSRKLA